ncbi:FAD binding domain-containing protein [Phreatobacter stygius]|uniref:FAD-binding molybdopterin dehydrogenase n=1 Tax=Phreatobacter stygius TaxID=1940610 RepID=A0A4D7BHT1_9HYPH|nr:FAD binding domain-containing protein [Phreatobacter stygius]QCI67377.1 FAD-binding molybdopterin dehydrogenase [Phreatobacter stygius]
MDLNTITEVKRPGSIADVTGWRPGHAWLAGGTWLFSEPQLAVDTLVDLEALGWPSLEASSTGLDIAATCRIGELERFAAPPDWTAAPLLRECSHALLMSFKIANEATVGGNICMSLPAGAMISLTTALEAVYTLWPRTGSPRSVAAIDFVTANNANVLGPGELLRAIHIPATALSKRFAFRRASLTRLGRSAALVIGTRDDAAGDLLLTITAATPRPVQLRFERAPDAPALRRAIDAHIPADGYFDDVHGTPAYKRHLTYHFAEAIRAELAAPGARA